MSLASQTLEHDHTPRWVEPFSALYWRIRIQTWLLGVAFVVVLLQGGFLYALGTRASAHVYEVRPDGEAVYIGDRDANQAPRESEARFVAKRFVELLYGWNSSTVHQDLSQAVNMCSEAMGNQLREELAAAQFLEHIRRRQIRGEVAFKDIKLEHGRRQSRVRLAGRVDIFPLTEYEGAPIESREFALVVVLAAVPRDPDRRLNGLEVVRIVRESAGAE